MSLVLGLETVQVDFSNAFCQANIAEEIYVEMPKDFGDPKGRDMVLKLKKIFIWHKTSSPDMVPQTKTMLRKQRISPVRA